MSFVKGPSPEFLITTLRRPLGVLQGYADIEVRHGTVTDQHPGPQIPDHGPKVYRRYRAVLDTEHGPRPGLRVTLDRAGGRLSFQGASWWINVVQRPAENPP